jgi:hypothetical protein
MGYRSEVYIAVPKTDEAELDSILIEYNLFGGDYFTKTNYLGYITYHCSHLKWYNNYNDVKAVNKFISKKPLDNWPKEGRCLVCIGEDSRIHSDIGEYQEVFNVYMKVELQ